MTDEPHNTVRRETIHHMGRRCFEWDYSSRCIYMITVELADTDYLFIAAVVDGVIDEIIEHLIELFRIGIQIDHQVIGHIVAEHHEVLR